MQLEKNFKLFYENADELFLIVNNDCELIDCNKKAESEFSKLGIQRGMSLFPFVLNVKSKKKFIQQASRKKVKIVFNNINKTLIVEGRLIEADNKRRILLLKSRNDQLELIKNPSKGNSIDPLEKILENIDIVFYRVKIDSNGKKNLFFVSKHVSEIFGLNYKDYMNKMKDGSILSFFHKADYPEILKTNHQIFEKKKASQVVYRFYNKQKKKYIWIEEKGYPVLGSGKKLVEMYGIAREVTDRIENEINLNRTANFYKNIIEDNLSGYYRINKKNIIIETNDSFAKILGYKNKRNIIGKSLNSLYKSSTDAKGIYDKIKTKKKLINHESKVVLFSGKIKHFLENISYFRDERSEEEYVEATIFDISEFKSTQEALSESEKKYKKLFEDNLAGVFRTSVSGKIYECNESFLHIYGYKSREEISKNGSQSLYFKKADRDKYIKDLKRKKALYNYELLSKRKDNTKVWVLANVSLTYYNNEEMIQGTLIDITKQKTAQENLFQNIDKYRKLFENASDAILIVKNWNIIDCNDISTRLFKTTKRKLEGLKFSDLIVYNELNKDQKKSYNDVFTNKNVYKNKMYECVVKDFKGEFLYVEIAVSVITENDEDIYQLIIHDNTKAIHEQKELERSKQNFENLIEFSPDGNVIIQQGKVIYTNKSAISILNLKSKKMLVGKPIISYFAPNHQNEIEKLIKLVFETKANTRFYEYKIKGENKKPFDVGVQLTYLKYGDLDCINMILYDLNLKKQLAQQELRANIAEEANKKLELEIIEHKKTQQKLSNQVAMNDALMEGSQNVLIYTLNRKYEVTSYNAIFEQMARILFGYDLKSDKSFTKFLEKVITPEDKVIMYEKFKKSFKGDSVRMEGPLLSESGNKIWIETFINPVKKGDKVVEISCISTDITEKKMKSEELKQSLKEKEVLLKEVHHRVKNNLQIISSILNLQTSFSNDTKVNEILKESQNRVKSMAYLHENLYQNKNFTYINFSDYLINLSKNLVHSYYLTENTVELDFRVEKVDLDLDKAIPCGLIVNELLTNAVKYAFNNSSKGVIRIEVHERMGEVTLIVADNGKGLAKGFDVNKTNTLGLQLVTTLTEQLEGQLKVKSTAGAEFCLTFKKTK